MVNKAGIELFYARHYKKLMLIPIIIFLVAFSSVIYQYTTTGYFLTRDVSLKGGITATVYTDQTFDITSLQSALGTEASVRRLTEFTTGKQLGMIVEVSSITSDQLKTTLETFLHTTLTQKNYSVEETGPKLGQAFYRQLIIALIIGFILMAISVSFTFKTFIPSIAVISAAFMDIIIPLAILNAAGFTFSSAGLVAFLLVIGYSVDTDILLTTWALRKREQTLFNRMWHSMQTGITMTAAAIVVMLIGIFISNSVVIREMFTIILIALITDLVSTYFTNSGILWWYAKKKNIQ